MITRLEPIIFAVIGYYFGRLPAQQTERSLRHEIDRQNQKADAAQYAKEQTQQAREALEEKVKNARVALASGSSAKPSAEDSDTAALRQGSLRQSIASALAILSS